MGGKGGTLLQTAPKASATPESRGVAFPPHPCIIRNMPLSVVAEQVKQQIPEIVDRYLKGESIISLAAEKGVHRQRLYEWMLAGIGDDNYHDTVTKVLVRRVAEADEALENPSVEPDTQRAHARARIARTDLERRRPGLYGIKQHITVDQRVSVEVSLSEDASSLLNHVRAAAQLPHSTIDQDSVADAEVIEDQ